MNPNDPQVQFFFSGDAHAYYALAGAILISLAMLFGFAGSQWAGAVLLLIGGVFADLWAHLYQH